MGDIDQKQEQSILEETKTAGKIFPNKFYD